MSKKSVTKVVKCTKCSGVVSVNFLLYVYIALINVKKWDLKCYNT